MKLKMRVGILVVASLLSQIARAQSAAPPAKPVAPAKSPFQSGRPPLKTRPSGNKEIIHTVADAMGFVRGFGPFQNTDSLNRLQWLGRGTMWSDGHKYEIVKYSYAMTLDLNGAREDIQRKAADGKSDRVIHAFLGSDAWNETMPGVGQTPEPGQAEARHLEFLFTPFGFTKALLKADPTTVKIDDPGPGGKVTIAVTLDGTPFAATLDGDYRPALISATANGQKVETLYSNYSDLAGYGVMFPTHIVQKISGRPTLDLTIDDGRVSSYLILQPPGTGGN